MESNYIKKKSKTEIMQQYLTVVSFKMFQLRLGKNATGNTTNDVFGNIKIK